MEFTRNIKRYLTGDDVKYIKDALVKLGYLYASTHNKFGNDSYKATKEYQKSHKDLDGKPLEVDGIVGEKTWNAIVRDIGDDVGDTETKPSAPPSGSVEFTRNLKRYMTGDDVKYIKDCLVSLGYLHASTHNKFGNDTYAAVMEYQKSHKDLDGHALEVDGIVGENTWYAIVRDVGGELPPEPKPEVDPDEIDIPSNIGKTAASKIAEDVAYVSEARRKIVLESLKYAHDVDNRQKYMTSLYLRGGNLYNKDLKPNVPTMEYLTGSYKKKYSEYCDGGRLEKMVEAKEHNPDITGCDCSGGIVGLCRWAKVVSTGFDANANSLCSNSHSVAIDKDDMVPGDWIGRDGHIGLYVGGGYVVEWVGGAYGCCLTKVNSRRVYNFVDGKVHTMSAWSKFRDPKYY